MFAAIAVAFVAAVPPAQANDTDATRKPTFARVETKDGAPLANAVVTFAGCMPHVGVEAGPCDVQLVQSDARGRAQCKLQPGLCYVAWAVGPDAGGGSRVVSDPYGWFGASSLITLRCGEARTPRTLPVTGADRWAAKGPLRYVACTCAPGTDTTLEQDAGGKLVVPVGPFRTLEVRTNDGAPLLHANIDRAQLVIPPLQRLRVRARDENGAPLAGASVRLRVGRFEAWRLDSFAVVAQERWRPLGVTGADGTCTVEVPYAADPLHDQTSGDLLVFVGAPGRPAVAGGALSRELFVNDSRVAKGERDELVFDCKRVQALAGSVGRVPAGTVVQLATISKMMVDQGWRGDARTYHAKVGADGSFAFDDVPADPQSCRFALVPAAGDNTAWPMFPAGRERQLPPEVQTPGASMLAADGLATLEVQVREAGGDPARGLVALLTCVNGSGLSARDSTVRFPLDARGTATVRLVPGRWAVTVCSDSGWVARLVDARAGSSRESLPMQAHQLMKLELHGADGRPIADARVRTRGVSVTGSGDPLQGVLQSLRSQWEKGWSNLRTDADGRVALPFVPLETVVQKVALVWNGGSTDDLLLAAAEEWTVVSPK